MAENTSPSPENIENLTSPDPENTSLVGEMAENTSPSPENIENLTNPDPENTNSVGDGEILNPSADAIEANPSTENELIPSPPNSPVAEELKPKSINEKELEEAILEATSELSQSIHKLVENPPTEPIIRTYIPKKKVFEPSAYMEPVPSPHVKAVTYLEKHGILQIFQNMTANIVYNRPENPLDYMISEIAEIKRLRASAPSAVNHNERMD